MPKLKSVSKPKRDILINVKVSKDEARAMKDNANEYANGNMSEWIRYCSQNLKPKKSDLTSE